MERVMPRGRFRRLLLIAGLVFLVAFIVGGGGAGGFYYRIVFGALPFALALGCFGGVAYLYGSDARRHAWIVSGMACWLLSAGVLAIWIRPAIVAGPKPEPPFRRAHVFLTQPQDRFRATQFTELQPVELSDCRFERFGERNDGGYLMCGNLLGSVKAGYSYGIAGYDKWGCDIASKLNVRVHEYDCFDLHKPSCSNGTTVFHPECIGPSRRTDEKGRVFDTLENQFAADGDAANRVVVKMDIEGAEWETLQRAPSSVLERIDQFAVEMHKLGSDQQIAVVRRLKEIFYLAHLHYNNSACDNRADPFPAAVVEALFVNKRLTTARGPSATPIHPLDAPNVPHEPDCQIPVGRWTNPITIPRALRLRIFR
jgi:hypothetical protein